MRTLTLTVFFTNYDLRPCMVMGPVGFLVGFGTIPGTLGWACQFYPETEVTTLLFQVMAVFWLLALWMFVRGCLNSLNNSFEWPLGEVRRLNRLSAQVLSTLPMLVGTLAGWHVVETNTLIMSTFVFVVTMVLWPLAWIRILSQK